MATPVIELLFADQKLYDLRMHKSANDALKRIKSIKDESFSKKLKKEDITQYRSSLFNSEMMENFLEAIEFIQPKASDRVFCSIFFKYVY